MSINMLSTQWTACPRLPPELTDRIIDHLHDSPINLRKCALVCRAWLPSCRFHIFRRIEIHPSYPPKDDFLGRLYEVIQRSPDITFYVQELLFTGDVIEPEQWPYLETKLLQLLDSFTSLKVVELEEISWSELTPPLRKALHSVFALPSIVDVSLVIMEFRTVQDVTDLIHTPLKRLHLDIEFELGQAGALQAIDEENEGLRSPGRKPCQLEFLRLSTAFSMLSGFDSFDWLLREQPSIDLSAIHTFDVSCNPKNVEDIAVRIMRKLGLSLQHLILRELVVEDWDGSIEDTIDLSCNPNIETLTVDIDGHPHLPRYLAMCLSRLPAGKLREITIDPMDNFTKCHWSELDDLLSSQPFETLQKLNFMGRFQEGEEEYVRIFDQFPLLVSRGILHCLQRIELLQNEVYFHPFDQLDI